jgi:hypothetical protein
MYYLRAVFVVQISEQIRTRSLEIKTRFIEKSKAVKNRINMNSTQEATGKRSKIPVDQEFFKIQFS